MLKTRLGVHEIFGGVALNSLASVVTIYLVTGPWSPPGGSSKQSTAPFAANSLLPQISSDFPVSLLMLIVVFVAIVAVILVLRGTRWGLQLKATGKNARSALLLGVPTTRSAISALMVCGALAGIAGSYRVLFTYNSLRTLVSGGIGFLALLVVLLVAVRALWAPFVAFAFAMILGGSTRLKIALQLDQSLAGVLEGLIVLLVLLANGLRQRFLERGTARDDLAGRALENPVPSRNNRRRRPMNDSLINILNSIVSNATPLVIAGMGETISERAGVINLSLDGSLALSAMFGFVAAQASGSVLVGILAAAIAGMVVALIVAVAGIELRQDQVAIGFVLTLLAADLAPVSGAKLLACPPGRADAQLRRSRC